MVYLFLMIPFEFCYDFVHLPVPEFELVGTSVSSGKDEVVPDIDGISCNFGSVDGSN